MIYHWDKTRPLMIDFEYSLVSLRGTDLASYFNEAQIDYTHPHFPYYKIYEEMDLHPKEKEAVYRTYLRRYYDVHAGEEIKNGISKEDFLKQEMPVLQKQVECCQML